MQWIWPDIVDMEDGDAQCHRGASVAFFVAFVTATVTFLQTNGIINWFGYITITSYIDAAVFFIIGIGLRVRSRIAALAGLSVYCLEQYAMIQVIGFRFNLLALLFIIFFMNAVRGAFAYHHFKREMKKMASDFPPSPATVSILTGLPIPPLSSPSPPLTAPETNKKKHPFVGLFMFLLTFAAAGFAVFIFLQPALHKKTEDPASNNQPPPSPLEKVIQQLETEKGAPPVDDENVKTFKLKSGKTVTGRVVVDDPVYLTIQISPKKQEIILREDLAKE